MAKPVRWQLSPPVMSALKAAGWEADGARDQGRVNTWLAQLSEFSPNGEARDILSEFGGVRVDQNVPGVECSRMPFWIDPTRAAGEDDRFGRFEDHSGRLFPVGEIWGGHAILGVNSEGRVFAVMDDLYLIGNDFGEALDRLVRGLKPLAEWSD